MLDFASTSIRPALFAAITAMGMFANPALADSSSGTIAVALNVTNACVVNGATAVQSNVGALGTIQFADQPGIFGNVDGQLVGALGTLQVLCSPGVTPSLTIGSGANDAAGKRYLASNGHTVPYRLFSDAARTSEITIGQQLALGTATTSAISVPIFARVNSGGAVLSAGSYADTVQVTLAW
ncbi:Csu type fimbrial protein [Sphingomonas profundi]|uniref:Csu type fimbrial protein n=1 Tax=Alterirhizorhabdus profundi TaxID=2681549 RepID=UPI0018D0F44F|nr:spore coat U domain-containing protein [Sphingomonas profundi]